MYICRTPSGSEVHADLSEYVVLALQLPCLPHPVLFTESRYPRITEVRSARGRGTARGAA